MESFIIILVSLLVIGALIILSAVIFAISEDSAKTKEERTEKTKEEVELYGINTAFDFKMVVPKYSNQALDLYNSLIETEKDIHNRLKAEAHSSAPYPDKEMMTIVAEEKGIALLEDYYKETVELINISKELSNIYSTELDKLISAYNIIASKISYLEINGAAHQGWNNTPVRCYNAFVSILNKTTKKYNEVRQKMNSLLKSDIAYCKDLKEVINNFNNQ